MKTLSCVTFMMDNAIEQKLIQRIHAFDSIEITEIIKTSARLIEKLNRSGTDLLFINLDNKEMNDHPSSSASPIRKIICNHIWTKESLTSSGVKWKWMTFAEKSAKYYIYIIVCFPKKNRK